MPQKWKEDLRQKVDENRIEQTSLPTEKPSLPTHQNGGSYDNTGSRGSSLTAHSGTGFNIFYMIWLLVAGSILGLMCFSLYDFSRLRQESWDRNQEKLQTAIGMFPKNPSQYNQRQISVYANQFWRRYNLRAMSITAACILSGLFLNHWHRQKLVSLHRRKTMLWWTFTLAAGLLGVTWGMYLIKQPPEAPFSKKIIKKIRKNPTLRAQIYLVMIIIAGLLLMHYITKHNKAMDKKRGIHHNRRPKTQFHNVL